MLEIRVRDEARAFPVFYVAAFEEAIYLLHCFQKKPQKTSGADLETGACRLRALMRERNG